MNKQTPSSAERRSFFSSLNAGFLSLAALAAGGRAAAQERPKAATPFEPARHDQDDWLDVPAKHRMVFDTTDANAFGLAMFFANNFIRANKSGYGLPDSDLAIVIVARHDSTALAYSDAMWAKYGQALATRAGVEDPKSKQPPKINIFNSADYGQLLQNRGVTLDALFKQGVRLAVCSSATRAAAGAIAKATGAEVEAVNKELIANLVGNSRMVPAGIVAVNRAQERGYTLVTT